MLLIHPTITFSELADRVQRKFKESRPLKLKYRDEGPDLVLMTDQEDLEIALAGANGDRLELWCFV